MLYSLSTDCIGIYVIDLWLAYVIELYDHLYSLIEAVKVVLSSMYLLQF